MKQKQHETATRLGHAGLFLKRAPKVYLKLFRPQKSPDLNILTASSVLALLLGGTVLFLASLLILLMLSLVMNGYFYLLPRIVLVLISLLYTFLAIKLSRRGHVKIAAILLLIFYIFLATLATVLWSITAPFGLLLFGFIIVLATTLLGSRYALLAAVLAISILLVVQLMTQYGLITPDRSPVYAQPTLLDVGGFGTVFIITALVSWISGRKIEYSLRMALNAETELLEEKQLLAYRLQERTEKLRAAQLKEMHQLYRFAELGQLSTALLHDLANHLTVLTLNIEDLHKHQHSHAIKRAKQSIIYLDKMVENVRSQLQGSAHVKFFSVISKVQEVIATLHPKLQAAGIEIEVTSTKRVAAFRSHGDPTRLQQILTILMSNAVDAYKHSKAENSPKRILVSVKTDKNMIVVSVRDWGVGISDEDRSKLFKPFYSTKDDGMGIGLFIAMQMIETHFKGTISLSDSKDYTEFTITIPGSGKHVKLKP